MPYVNAAQIRPWMFFVTNIYPPIGPSQASEFSADVYRSLRTWFDTTSYQVILLKPYQTVESISNRKKDLKLLSDPHEYFKRGDKDYDTLFLWMQYRTGFFHSRLSIPYKRGMSSTLPSLIAREAFTVATTEFLAEIHFEAGPPGTLIIFEDISILPPVQFLIPPGQYAFTATMLSFKSRTDTLDILPGKSYRKRMLLLPVNDL